MTPHLSHDHSLLESVRCARTCPQAEHLLLHGNRRAARKWGRIYPNGTKRGQAQLVSSSIRDPASFAISGTIFLQQLRGHERAVSTHRRSREELPKCASRGGSIGKGRQKGGHQLIKHLIKRPARRWGSARPSHTNATPAP
jgi:hypothetical protein